MAAKTSPALSVGGTGPLSSSLKAPATSSTTSESVHFKGNRSASSPARGPSPSASQQRRAARPSSSDFLSDKTTAALIRRTLCSEHLTEKGRRTPPPIHDLLPPLTSRNDVDLQLYALISIIIKEFVQNWYARVTPDETFVAEIVQIIAHCTRALEQRLRNVDLESLLFDELPELLDGHVRAYRTANNTPIRPPAEVDAREIYHSLYPVPGLSPVPRPGDHASLQAQVANESAYRQLLVQGVLAVLLPTEDLENDCLTSIVGQIFSELIIGNLIANKMSQPWLIYELLIIVVRIMRKKSTADHSGLEAAEADTFPSTQSRKRTKSRGMQTWSIHRAFWLVVHWAFLAANFLRFAFHTMVLSRSLPSRTTFISSGHLGTTSHGASEKSQGLSDAPESQQSRLAKVPIADFRLWSCIGNLLELDFRMPWLRGTLSLAQWGAMNGPGRIAGFDGIIDRLLSHYIHTHILDPVHLPPLLRAIRGAVFPNNAPGSPSLYPPSSDGGMVALRRRCASALLSLVPKRVGRLYYGSNMRLRPGTGADSTTKSSANARSGPLKGRSSKNNNSGGSSSKSSSIKSDAHDNAKSTGHEAPRVRLTYEGNPRLQDDATSASADPKRQLSATTMTNIDENPTDAGDEDGGYSRNTTDAEDDVEEQDRVLSEIEADILDVFSDQYCNKHLLYGILELVLVRLVPELAEKGVVDLLGERLG